MRTSSVYCSLLCVLQVGHAVRLDAVFESQLENRMVDVSNDTQTLVVRDVGMHLDDGDDSQHWQAQALARCKTAARNRIIKILVSAPLIIIGGNYITMSLVQGGVLASFVAQVGTQVSWPIWNVLFRIGSSLSQFTYVVGDLVPTVFLKVLYYLVTGTLGAVYTSSALMLGLAPVAAAFWGPIVLTSSAAVAVTEITLNQALQFLGHGPVHPKCCCSSDPTSISSVSAESINDTTPDLCGLVTPTDGVSQTGCPSGWDHSPGKCAMPEMVEYIDKTMQGCTCNVPEECGSSGNKPWKGHAWCWVGAGCGRRSVRGRWDYCLFGGDPLEKFKGSVPQTEMNVPAEVANPLAAFVPNTCAKTRSLSARNPYRLGSYTDTFQAITSAKAEGGSRECFAGFPSESLGECAESCLVRGAVSALNVTHKCQAFAFHRTSRVCVTLPSFATDAMYSPVLKQWGGDGWQNFVSKFHGCEQDNACQAEAFLDIEATGYQVVKDSNSGFLHLQCVNNASAPVVKATCHADMCTKGSTWCFVSKTCGFWKKCREIEGPFDCSPEMLRMLPVR